MTVNFEYLASEAVTLLGTTKVRGALTTVPVAGFSTVGSCRIDVDVNSIRGTGVRSFTLIVEDSPDGVTWSTVHSWTFNNPGTGSFEATDVDDQMRVRFTTGGGLREATVGGVVVVPARDASVISGPQPEGEGPPIAELDDGVDSIYAIGALAAAPASGSLVLAVHNGAALVQVTLAADVIDSVDDVAAAAAFGDAGVTVTAEGQEDGTLQFEFTGDYGHKPITLTTISNTIVDGNDDPIALDPADPVEVQAGVANTPGDPADPEIDDHYLDTRTGLTWTLTEDGWMGGHTLDYAEITAPVAFSDDAENPDVVVTGSEITLDGTTPITVEFYSYNVVVLADEDGYCAYTVALYDGETLVAPLADGDKFVQVVPLEHLGVSFEMYVRSPTFTPAAGDHSYSARAFSTNTGAGGTVGAGTGPGDSWPAYLRVNRA